ncbi:hypothetical protein KI387_023668, partial [Taxus chinensis]
MDVKSPNRLKEEENRPKQDSAGHMGQVGREYANWPNRAKKFEAVQSKVKRLGQYGTRTGRLRAKSAQGALNIWDIRDEKTRR